jgi:hypothetical protein
MAGFPMIQTDSTASTITAAELACLERLIGTDELREWEPRNLFPLFTTPAPEPARQPESEPPLPEKPTDMLTVKQVAVILHCSRDTVIRRFAHEPGVVDLSDNRETTRTKRRFRQLRIPRSVVTRFLQKRRVN